jgi:hypothetical protein
MFGGGLDSAGIPSFSPVSDLHEKSARRFLRTLPQHFGPEFAKIRVGELLAR